MHVPTLHHSKIWTHKGIPYKVDVYSSNNFDGLQPIKQCYGVLMNERNEVAMVLNHNKYWILPGGKPESGETPLQTLERELKEETNCDIDPKKAIPFYYQELFIQQGDGIWRSKGFELRYIVPLKQYHTFVADPDKGDITKVTWCSIEDITRYLDWWGDTGVFIKETLPQYLPILAR